MWKSGRISMPDFRQPNEEAVQAIKTFAEAWNNTHKDIKLIYNYGGWDLFLTKETFHIYPTIVAAVKEMKSTFNIYVTYRSEKHYEEEDYLKADFIQFSSWQIEAATPFVLNDDEISPAGGHCPKCGSWSPLTHKTKPPLLIIDESLLKTPMEELTKPDDEEWDLIYASTHLMISAKFKRILEENKIKGYTLLPTINHKTDKASEKMFQLLANKATYVCALPEGVTKQPFCDTCGSAKEIYDFDFAVSKEWIGEDDFFARSDYKGTSLHMSNRVFKLFRQHKLNGLDPLYAVAAL